MPVKQYILTSSAGKRLIAKAILQHPAVKSALARGTLVVVAGSTNGYVAEEILASISQAEGFSRAAFRRGTVIAPGNEDKIAKADFPGDVVIARGKWQKGKTIFDVAENLGAGDVILKGGNALDVAGRRAAVLVGHPQCGTAGAIIPAVVGRRATLIVPIGLEKRVADSLDEIAAELNSPETDGPRFLPLPGEIFTELDAIKLLTGASARLAAGGGIYGAEGAAWLAVKGDDSQLRAADSLLKSVATEPPCEI